MPIDEDLARAVQQGDEDALRRLVEQHHGPLLGFLFRMTNGERPLAEDLVQETLLRMMRAIGQYQYPRPFKSWLYAIAVNVTRDYYRRPEHRYSQEPLTVPATGSLRPEPLLLRRDELTRVKTAVARLPPRQRAAILLRYQEGMSLAEIAAILDIPVGTVKSRLSLALKALRTQLDQDD